MQQLTTRQTNVAKAAERIPEARYSYYRRCQMFRRNGEQCKAPAEKGAAICHAHAAQQATAFRRDLERRTVLAEAVAEMRRQGKRDCDMTNLLMDFKGIQVTLAVMARALIAGRIDCKTAGRLVVHLQTMSKLLATLQGKSKTSPLINTDNTDLKRTVEEPSLTTEARRHGEQQGTPQVSADERRLDREQELPVLPAPQAAVTSTIGRAIHDEEPEIVVNGKIREFPEESRNRQHGKWEEARAA